MKGHYNYKMMYSWGSVVLSVFTFVGLRSSQNLSVYLGSASLKVVASMNLL